MKTTKKLVAAIAAFVMALAFASCGSNEDKVAGNTYECRYFVVHFNSDGTGYAYLINSGKYYWDDKDGEHSAETVPENLSNITWVQDKKAKEIIVTRFSEYGADNTTFTYADASVRIKYVQDNLDLLKK